MKHKLKDISLIINTADNQKSIIRLDIPGRKSTFETLSSPKSDQVLEMINGLLVENKITLSEIDRILVNTGPGSYTGIRVGIAIAQTLSLMTGIPVFNLNSETDLDPVYESDRYSV